MSQLYTTGVPLPFTCEYAAIVDDAVRVERALHLAFGDKRLHDRREFFELDPSQARVVLELLALEEITPGVLQSDLTEEEVKAVERQSDRRKRFNFAMVNIPQGTILKYVNDETITATVVGKSKIMFNDKLISLSAAASELLVMDGFGWAARSCAGPVYWMYQGETLDQRRKRMEEED